MIEPTVIIVPVLRRPHRVQPLMESIAAATPEPHRLLFVASADDRDELAALEAAGADVLVTAPKRSSYPCKINDGYHASTEPLVFLGADDLHPHAGWLPAACAYLKPGIEVVGTNDLYNPRVLEGRHSTHSLVRRSYIETVSGVVDAPDTVLHEEYPHEFCDDEFIQTARQRAVYAHAHDSIVEHLHPYAGKAPTDPIYELGHSRYREGRRIFMRRRRLWRTQSPLSAPPSASGPGSSSPRNARGRRSSPRQPRPTS